MEQAPVRLAQRKEDGDKKMDSAYAETLARQYVGNLLFGRNGFRHVLPVDDETYRACTRKG
jgi:hypothetical protein